MLRNCSSSFYRSIMMTIVVFLLAGGITAWAGSLQDLRASGALGESTSGYAVVRDPSATAEVASINEKRKEVYALSLIHISEPTRQAESSSAVFCLKKKTHIPSCA